MSETTEAKFIGNFENLVARVTALGARYNSPNAGIGVAALSTALADAKALRTVYLERVAAEKDVINQREAEFADVSAIATRVNAFVESLGLPADVAEDVRSLKRKLQGKRAKSKTPDDPATPLVDESAANNSASQMSYLSRADNFEKLIQLIETQPAYAPNEAAIQTATLTTKLTALQARNSAATTAGSAAESVRNQLDGLLYENPDSLFTLAKQVKAYCKAALGANDPDFKDINALAFEKPKPRRKKPTVKD